MRSRLPKVEQRHAIKVWADIDRTTSPMLIDDCAVILLDGDYPEGQQVKSMLQSQGLQVFVGPHGIDVSQAVMVIIHIANRKKPDVQARMQLTLANFPIASIYWITGLGHRPIDYDHFRDLRTSFVLAGLKFLSTQPLPNYTKWVASENERNVNA